MMKLKILILVFATLNILHAECINSSEKVLLSKSIEFFNDYYGDVENFIDCKNQTTSLDKFVCKNPDYLQMFYLLSQSNVYAYENATKTEVDHTTFNKKHMTLFGEKYQNKKNINPDHLCFDLKNATIDDPGVLECPYKMTRSANHVYFIQENKHGAVLTDRDGYKVYMGKNCDAEDSKKQKGSWYKEDDQYIIKLGKEKMVFDFPNLNLENYKCVQK